MADKIQTVKVTEILLAPEDREVVLLFKKHRAKFLILLQAGVFDVESGQANININNSQIQNVFVNKMVYKLEVKNDKIPT